MTKEQVLARKIMLEQQRDQLIANGNAIVGAIQECMYWLAEIDRASKETGV